MVLKKLAGPPVNDQWFRGTRTKKKHANVVLSLHITIIYNFATEVNLALNIMEYVNCTNYKLKVVKDFFRAKDTNVSLNQSSICIQKMCHFSWKNSLPQVLIATVQWFSLLGVSIFYNRSCGLSKYIRNNQSIVPYIKDYHSLK